MARIQRSMVQKEYRKSGFGKWISDQELSDVIPADLVIDAIDIMQNSTKQIGRPSGGWRGQLAIPPGSFIETLTANFNKNSSIAPELPMMAAFSNFASYLCKNRIRLQSQGVVEWPYLWLAILAGSGAGKTFVLDYLSEILGEGLDVIEGTEVPTSKAFLERLSTSPNALFLVDEMGPFFANAKNQSYLSEMTGYLLHIYTHKTIDRSVGGKSLRVENPVLNVLGYSATGSFFDDFDPKYFLNGLAQRFAWILVEDEPDEQMAIWRVRNSGIITEIKQRWRRITENIKPESVYYFPEDGKAERAFQTAYTLINKNQEIPDGFFRRMMHNSVKRYALIYHLLLGKANVDAIDEEDVAWATRLAYIHATDTKKILMNASLGRLGTLLKKTEDLAERIRINEGREITARDVVRTLNAVKTTAEAKSLIAMMAKKVGVSKSQPTVGLVKPCDFWQS